MSNYINKINIKGTEYDIKGNITLGSSPYASDVVTDTILLGSGLRHDYNGNIGIDRKLLIGTDPNAIIRISDNMIGGWGSNYIRLKVPTTSINEVITKDLYYNDGSNKHVPVRHPDLSTQPSILPYKFMGQYVYELLIPLNKSLDEINNASFNISAEEFDGTNIFLRPNVGVLEANLVLFIRHDTGEGYSKPAAIRYRPVKLTTYEQYGEVYSITVEAGSFDAARLSLIGAWLRIVYTSMPEEGGDDYGYNNY